MNTFSSTTPQPNTIVKTEVKETGQKTGQKQGELTGSARTWFKPGQTGNPKGRPKKPKDILQAMAEQLEEIRSKNPDGTPGKTAAELIAKNAIEKALIDKDNEMIKWVTERIHGKVPNINQNLNTNVDLADILDQARGIKIVENLDSEDGEPTIVEVK